MALGDRGNTGGGGTDLAAFTLTWTLPSGGSAPASGDLILLWAFFKSADRTLATPSGYSVVTGTPITGGGEGEAKAFYKTAAGSDANPTAAAGTGADGKYRWLVQVVSGTTPEIVDSDATETTDYSTAPTMPTSAAGGNTVWSIVFMGCGIDNSETPGWPAGWTEIRVEHAGVFQNRNFIAHNTSPGTGSVGGGGISLTSGQGQEKVLQVLVKEGGAAAGVAKRSTIINQAVNRAANW